MSGLSTVEPNERANFIRQCFPEDLFSTMLAQGKTGQGTLIDGCTAISSDVSVPLTDKYSFELLTIKLQRLFFSNIIQCIYF